jgi:putative acetyltransferase
MASESRYRMREASEAADFAAGRILFKEYAAQLSVDLCFQGFEAELERLPAIYGPPLGSLFLVSREGTEVGCGALRRLSEAECEMKRLYVRAQARGANLGRLIAKRLIDKAQSLGYSRMLLDTLAEMTPARTLYHSLGFEERSAYYANPLDGVVYMELKL